MKPHAIHAKNVFILYKCSLYYVEFSHTEEGEEEENYRTGFLSEKE